MTQGLENVTTMRDNTNQSQSVMLNSDILSEASKLDVPCARYWYAVYIAVYTYIFPEYGLRYVAGKNAALYLVKIEKGCSRKSKDV